MSVTRAPWMSFSPTSRAARWAFTEPYSPSPSVSASPDNPRAIAWKTSSSGCEAPSRKE